MIIYKWLTKASARQNSLHNGIWTTAGLKKYILKKKTITTYNRLIVLPEKAFNNYCNNFLNLKFEEKKQTRLQSLSVFPTLAYDSKINARRKFYDKKNQNVDDHKFVNEVVITEEKIQDLLDKKTIYILKFNLYKIALIIITILLTKSMK